MNDFNHIKDFLKKFTILINDKDELIRITSSSIFKNINFKIEDENIKTKSGVIYIKTTPLIKNEILIRKESILKEINTNLKNKINDIK